MSTAGSRRVKRGRISSTASEAQTDVSVSRLRSSRPSKKARISSMNPSASVEKPNSFGSWPDDDRDAQPDHVADLDLLREQVGDEPQLAETEADLDRGDESASIPASTTKSTRDRW